MHFERVSVINSWDDRQRADHLMVALKGPASEVACSCMKETKLSYGELVKALEQHFGMMSQRTRHRAELTSRRRWAGKTIAELGQAIHELVHRAYPEIGLTFREGTGPITMSSTTG